MKKQYIFLAVLLIAMCTVAAVSLISREKAGFVYQPQEISVRQESSAETEMPSKVIRKTKTVYFYADSTVFHIDPECSGMEKIPGKPCGYALSIGLEPCGRCLKEYLIID